jgi:hypothetical protein
MIIEHGRNGKNKKKHIKIRLHISYRFDFIYIYYAQYIIYYYMHILLIFFMHSYIKNILFIVYNFYVLNLYRNIK